MTALRDRWKALSNRWKIALGVVAAGLIVALGVAWWLIPPSSLGFAGGQTVALSEYAGSDPTGVSAELRAANIVTRGRYLTQLGGCEVCHTAPGGTPFAGGYAFKTAFGTLYSPNITADRTTGIGDWSDADFLRAVHRGVAKDGSYLYPAFPYESYTLLTDADVLAMKAYLFSLPRISQTVPANTLAFPFNQRWLMAIWSFVYTPGERFQPHTDKTPAWNRGAYLVEGLGHCNDCHTERNLAQAPNNRRKFAGGVSDAWLAYNITQDRTSGIGAWSDAELAHYLVDGHAIGRGSAGGPMADVVDHNLQGISASDVQAMIAYLRTVPAVGSSDLPASRALPAPLFPRLDQEPTANANGRRVFQQACASCHSWSGVSPLVSNATLTGSRAVNDASATNVAAMVLFGTKRRTAHGSLSMPAFGNSYSDTEIAAVANYVTGRFGAEGSSITADKVNKLRQ